ncbi:MAG: NADPH-dependent FMN reductase [Gammaproteobacteria bacterium]
MVDEVRALGERSNRATKNILAVAGSIRSGSYNQLLLRTAAKCAPGWLKVNVYAGLASLPLFNEDEEARPPAGPESVRALRSEVVAADGILIATPEYNQSVPGVLKNAIDWLSRPGPEEVLVRKPVAVIGASTGPWGTRLSQAALRHVLHATGSLVMTEPTLFVRNAESVFDDRARLIDPQVHEKLLSVLFAFDRWIDWIKEAAFASAG